MTALLARLVCWLMGVYRKQNWENKSWLLSGQESLGLGKLGNLMIMVNKQFAERVIMGRRKKDQMVDDEGTKSV